VCVAGVVARSEGGPLGLRRAPSLSGEVPSWGKEALLGFERVVAAAKVFGHFAPFLSPF